jgi:cephalosporin hydroxylase
MGWYQQLYRVRRAYQKQKKFTAEAKRLSRQASRCDSIEQIYEVIQSTSIFIANQKRGEIIGLLQLLDKLKPQAMCEIGTQKGGTLFLLAHAGQEKGKVISVDLSYPSKEYRSALKYLGMRNQKITCIEGDSHQANILNQVNRCIGVEKLDFLFIDGDHTFEGVKLDYEMYSPLVRRGGIIAFHDIVSDFNQKYGIKSNSYTGGVPRFWEYIKRTEGNTVEFVESLEQDGYGIGVVIQK